MSKHTLHFIKPCRKTDSSPRLTPNIVAENKRRGIETTLLLDLNILIRMEDVILRKHSPNDFDLTRLINFINLCPSESLCLTPGLALSEVHPKFKKLSFEIYEVFLSIFCPGMVDHPTATRNTLNEEERTRAYEFSELSIEEQYLYSVSLFSLMQIHIISAKHHNLSGVEKFELYLARVCGDIDMLSAVEAEIAKYCFCDKKLKYSKALNDKIEHIKENFMSGNSKPKQRFINIFNGVQDLKYIRGALEFSQEYFYGKPQDTWIATLDSKLYWLSESVHHYPVAGERDGKYFSIVRSPDQETCDYWMSVDRLQEHLQEKRRLNGKGVAPLGKDGMPRIHKTLTTTGFEEFFAVFKN
ncbi:MULTISPECIES: hypothetical protein [unclassified Pseudomonas]|uniref:hypothetical protein n=1 Tax=unclassified Pseudomonas TaxID=196821 RepID=UPI0014637708|nr:MULTISPECIES: hypothetical protein [unclassified Pseudomonas]QJI18738.1 hypothetical protein HKK57_10765 [Pseudomonas sp. ADAK21]QJI26106.1 hypothetical protein HKK56_22320 [Pseudomonas sp. ADAK20]